MVEKNIAFFCKWPVTLRVNEYMFKERARHTVFNLLNCLLKFKFSHGRHGDGKYTTKCSLMWKNNSCKVEEKEA